MRPSKLIAKLEDRVIAFYEKNKDRLPRYILIALILLYAAGFIIRSAVTGLNNIWRGGDEPLFTLNPVKNIASVFTPQGFGIIIFSVLMYCLFTGKGKDIISGYKTVKDKKRGIEILPEGTHGTSGFMDKKELPEFLYSGSLKELDETLFGKLDNGEYVAMKDMPGMSKNVMVYGAPGTGKSRGFVMPFVMQAARRGESIVLVDPKAEFYEMYSEFFRERGYTVKAYNLLDLFASDGWNCVMDTAQDINLVQRVAEIIIRNTSNENERGDFWEKAEKNLLIAQLSDRYPKNEWQEIVGDSDYQLFLGCNDAMTAEFISKQCGEVTVRVNNMNTPTRPFFDSIVLQKPYMHNKTSTGRPLMMPDEVRRLAKDKAILLIRGAKPLLLNKITPEEHPSFKLLKYCKAAEHIPEWRKEPVKKTKKPPAPKYSLQFEIPVDGEEEEKEDGFDLSGGIDCRSLKKLNEREI